MILWLKEEILQLDTEQVVNQSMVRNSRMKTSSLNIPEEVTCQWLMQVLTQMGHNFSCALSKQHGSMVKMLSLVKSLMDWKFLIISNQLVHKLDKQKHHASLPI